MMALTIMPGLAPRLKLCVAYIDTLGNIYDHMTIDHRHGEDFSFGEIGHALDTSVAQRPQHSIRKRNDGTGRNIT